jgi:(R)-2-hydroxyacyl-CoA dehydratese activating ATPase
LRYAGLDVGSRTTKLVVLEGEFISHKIVDSGVNPLRRCQELLSDLRFGRLVVTGYGRHLVAPLFQGEVITEIKAFAVGVHHLYPEARTIIDIGGQDSKIIRLSETGEVVKFEMNDRCAAGTGKFMEIMAATLETGLSEFGAMALKAQNKVRINSLCTVFAESEVVSLIAKGEQPEAITFGLHEAIASRIASMVLRAGLKPDVAFVGGGSLNICLRELLMQKLEVDLFTPPNPQTAGALGAALIAAQYPK